MYYGARPSGIGFAETTLDRLHDWKRHGKPILTAGQGNAFDANGVNAPKVLPITDTHWHMYYVGYHPNATSNGAPVHQIGLAESDDAGLTWRQYPDPIIPRGESADDVFSTSSASVLRVGEQWYLWYTAIAQVPYLASICLATSSDGGHTWTKYDRNPVLRFNPYLQAESFVLAKPHMLYEDGLFKMWYSAKGFGEGTSLGDYRVCYAESIDGMTWERFPGNPVLRPTDSGWDSTMVEYAEVAHIDDKYHMWYCGDGYGQIGYAQGEHASRVEVCIRSGRTAKPDATWSDWSQPLTDPPGTRYNVGEAHAGSSNNHVQMRVTLVASGSPSPPRVEGLWIDSVKTSSP